MDRVAAEPISTAARSPGHGPAAKPRRLSPEAKPVLDRSGRKRFGKASYYASMFAGRTMTDGTRMRPNGNNAASRTLPLGTTAIVTNLQTGKTAVVTIRDRGPYVDGRIVDLSPATAREIGLDRRIGVTAVEVAPIVVPLPDGRIKSSGAMACSRPAIACTANNEPPGRRATGVADRRGAAARHHRSSFFPCLGHQRSRSAAAHSLPPRPNASASASTTPAKMTRNVR